MMADDTQKILANIIQGIGIEGETDHLAAARNHLCRSFGTSTKVERNFEKYSPIKKEQAEHLAGFADVHTLWLDGLPFGSRYLAEGGEAKIYLAPGNRKVIKINDAVYYNTWLCFLNSVLLHNVFFGETAYTLLGFTLLNSNLHAVLQQPFVIADTPTDLDDVTCYLEFNGFYHKRRTDYYNRQLGLLLEDIHEENVLTFRNKLFFIDTVFYLDEHRL
jgi:hypothetical protein